jgi:hypothetical protein
MQGVVLRDNSYLDDNDKPWLEERGVCCRIQNRRTWLEWLEKSADVTSESEIVAKEDLLGVRRESRK